MTYAILDQTGDLNYQDLNRFSNQYLFPLYANDYVEKSASLAPAGSNAFAEGLSQLPPTAFADPAHRQFPCHTKAACYFSALYFTENATQVDPRFRSMIDERLTKAARHFGIEQDLVQLRAKHAELYADRTDQLPDSSFALVLGSGETKERHFPLRNGLEVKAAAQWLQQYQDEFTFDERHLLANKILEKAGSFGAAVGEELDSWLEKQAGRGVFDPALVADVIEYRVKAANPKILGAYPELKDGMLKIAQAVRDNPQLAFDMNTARDIASQIDQFDHVVGLVGKYAAMLPRVEDALFGISIKAAQEALAGSCVIPTGSIYHIEQFAKLALSDVAVVLGDDLASAVAEGLHVNPTKMADVAPTLPRADAQALDRLMQEVGEVPYAKEATAQRISQEDREALAGLYETQSR